MEPDETSDRIVREVLARRAARTRAPVVAEPLPRPASLPPMSEYLSVKRLSHLLPLTPPGHGPSRTSARATVWRLADAIVRGALARRHAAEDQALAAIADATVELGTRLDDLTRSVERMADLLDQRLATIAARLDQPPGSGPATPGPAEPPRPSSG